MSRAAFIAAQPVQRVQQFAELVGWPDLRVYAIEWPEFEGRFFVAYCTTHERFNLQIARRQDLGPDHYTACVVAERYGITAVSARVRLHRATRTLRLALAHAA